MAISIFVIARILIGCLFVVSGFEKLIGSYQNFLYVVQSYEFLSAPLEEIVARVMPWGELLLGVFMVLGLWLKWVLRALLILVAMFICIVSQALIRGLPITECGCFGELISFPLHVVLLVDGSLLFLIMWLLNSIEQTGRFSLDNYFLEKP